MLLHKKLPKEKRPKALPLPPLIAPSPPPLIKDPPKAINTKEFFFWKKIIINKNPILGSTCIRRAWEKLSPNFFLPQFVKKEIIQKIV